MKIVKENLDKKVEISEGLKMGGIIYYNIRIPGGNVFVGEEGILGLNRIHIPWKIIEKFAAKYENK